MLIGTALLLHNVGILAVVARIALVMVALVVAMLVIYLWNKGLI